MWDLSLGAGREAGQGRGPAGGGGGKRGLQQITVEHTQGRFSATLAAALTEGAGGTRVRMLLVVVVFSRTGPRFLVPFAVGFCALV